MNLTNETARALSPTGSRKWQIWWDAGLSILGVKSVAGQPNQWVARVDGDSKALLIGPCDAIPRREAEMLAVAKVRSETLGSDGSDQPYVHHIIDQFVDEARCSEESKAAYRRRAEAIKKVIPRGVKPAQCKRDAVQAWVDACTVNRAAAANIFKMALRRAGYEWPYGVKIKRKRKRVPRILSWTEWSTLWDALDIVAEDNQLPYERLVYHRMSAFFKVMLVHPLRPWSELLPRKWSDIQKVSLDVGDRYALHLPRRKNDYGKNTADRIVLLPLAWEALDSMPGSRDGYMFYGQDESSHIHSTTMARHLKRACDLAGIGTVVPYDLRHTAITRLAEAGVDPSVQALLSGSTARTLQTYYQRPTWDAAARAIENIGYGERVHGV